MNDNAYVALGANLGRREESILCAVRALERHGAGCATRISSLYESAAVGMGTAPPFVNAVVELVPLLQARDLLDRLQAIEVEFGRKSGHNQSREIDLDLVAYQDQALEADGLVVPHPRYRQRAFVLVPLVEIAPNFRDPRSRETIKDLIAALSDAHSVRRVSGRTWAAST